MKTARRNFLTGLFALPLATGVRREKAPSPGYTRPSILCSGCAMVLLRAPKNNDRSFSQNPDDFAIFCMNPRCSQYEIRYQEPRLDVELRKL